MMENEIVKIIKGCQNIVYSRAEEEDFSDEFGKTRVFKVQGDEKCLYFWNSSNSSPPRVLSALINIANELLDGNEAGSVQDGWSEIMFEIK